MRGPGFWKLNNSHLENQYFIKMIRKELRILVHENQTDEENKTLGELLAMSPENLQKIGLRLNPHELIEQIHYRLKERIITYSKIKQEERKREKYRVESSINGLKEELKQNTLGENERLQKTNSLTEMENSLDKMEEHLAKGTSIRSKQEWDNNAEGPGKILLKCENKYGQQKYMHSIIKKE